MSDYDIAVIGAGVAGLNAAVTAARHGKRTVLIDRLGAGGQIITVDRIENFPGPAEGMSGYELGPSLHIQADEAGAEFMMGVIDRIECKDGSFSLFGEDVELTTDAVIVAAGSAKRKLGIEGEEEFEGRGVSHCASCDGPLMKGKAAIVIGGGDSAFDEALALAPHAERVIILHRGKAPRARAGLQEKAVEAGNIEVRLETVADRIAGTDGVSAVVARNLASGDTEEIACHGVFIYVGLEPQADFVDGLANKADDGRIIVDLCMRSNCPGLFAAGDIRAESVAHLAASAGDGVTAAISAVKYLSERGAGA